MTRRLLTHAGQLELGFGIAVLAALLALPLAMAGAKDVSDWASGAWNKQEKPPPPPTVTIPTFTSPPLPAANDPRYACYISRAGTLRWNGALGWRDPADPPPTLTGIYKKDQPEVADWTKRTADAVAAAKFAECDQEPPKPPPPEPPPPKPNVQGTYNLAFQQNSDPNCSDELPKTIKVGVGPDTTTITSNGLSGGGTYVWTGPVPDSSYSFSANGSIQANGLTLGNGEASYRVLGRFDIDETPNGNLTVIRNGEMDSTGGSAAGGQCSYSFTGTRSGD